MTARTATWFASVVRRPRAVLAAADQATVAAANFVTAILVARQLSLDAFGTFVLVYAAMLFGGGLQSTLVTQPHNVLGAGKSGKAYADYTTAIALGQLVLAICMAALMLVAAGVVHAAGWSAALLAATAPAILAWQGHEFTRRVLYTEERIAAALVVDVVGYGGQIFGIAALWRLNALTGPSAMAVIATASTAAALMGTFLLRRSFTRSPDWRAIGQNWRYGRWLTASHLLGEWLSAQLLVFIAAAVIGPAAAGIVRVADTLFGPSRILNQVFSITLPTQLVRARQRGGDGAFREHMGRATRAAVVLLGGYCLLVTLLAQPLTSAVFGEAYRQYASIIGLYALFAFFTYLATLLVAALCAREQTRAVFACEALSLIVTPVSILLTVLSGMHGLVLGLVLGEAALVLLLWHAYRQTTRKSDIPALPAAAGVGVSEVAL